MEFLGFFLVLVLGFVLGSFVSCISYRIPKDIAFFKGRSFCPNCKNTIKWYDNIPVISYLLLAGRCRSCGKSISVRYPIIEVSTAILFASSYLMYNRCYLTNFYFCSWNPLLGTLTFPFLLFILVLAVSVFVIDWEETIIPDELIFLGFVVALSIFFITDSDFFLRLFLGFGSSLFLLFLNLVTRGRGMGLGDVKFALFAGILFNSAIAVYWLFSSFLIGSVVGVILILLGKAKFGAKIPFGPFLVISLILFLFFGSFVKMPI